MATKTVKASTAFNQVVRSVEAIKNDERAIVVMSPGDVIRQGDIYLLMLDREIPGGKPAASRQLAPGTTRGSRHVAVGDCDVLTVDESEAARAVNRLVPATKGQTLFIGPMVRSRGEFTVEHPEHGDRTIVGEGSFLVLIQRAWSLEIRRAQD